MATLSAIERTFPVIYPRRLGSIDAVKSDRVSPLGSLRTYGFNWSPIVVLHDTTISSSTWSTDATFITTSSPSNTTITSQINIEAVGTGTAVLKNTVTCANGEKFSQYLEVEIVSHDNSSDGQFVAASGVLGVDWALDVDGVEQSAGVDRLDFNGTDFTVTESPANDFDIALNVERIQDIVGDMVSSNTESGITVTYQDADGTLDFTTADLTIAGDSGSTAMSLGDTLSIVGSGDLTTTMSGDTLTIGGTLDAGKLEATFTAGESLNQGDIVYFDGVTGKVKKADADGAGSGPDLFGIAQTSAALDASVVVTLGGQATSLSGLTAGSVYYLSTTAGGLTAVAPSGAGVRLVRLGVATATTKLVFNPQIVGVLS